MPLTVALKELYNTVTKKTRTLKSKIVVNDNHIGWVDLDSEKVLINMRVDGRDGQMTMYIYEKHADGKETSMGSLTINTLYPMVIYSETKPKPK